MHRILELIEKHSDITPAEIAVMLDMPETDVKNAIAQFEREGIIVGKKTVINWNKTDREYVTAFIELKVTPQQDKGFDQIAVMLDMPEPEVKDAITQFEKEGIIVGRKTVINWNKTDREYVTAFIELKVTPQQDKGFDQIAEAFYQYDQVRSVYLMSGAFDLALIIEGRSLKEVALFVSEKLAPMDTVISTATHFVLKKYKDDGLFIESAEKKDERQVLGI